MADLIDRLAFHAEITGRPKLGGHTFNAWLRLYADGAKRSRAQVAAAWDLQGDEITQANALADNIDAETTKADKMHYLMLIDGIMMMLNINDPDYVTGTAIDKAKVKTDLGIT